MTHTTDLPVLPLHIKVFALGLLALTLSELVRLMVGITPFAETYANSVSVVIALRHMDGRCYRVPYVDPVVRTGKARR